MKNNLGWIVALVLLAGQPALSGVPTLCLWDMYALAAVAGLSSNTNNWSTEVPGKATHIANEMIKRRSK